MSNLGLTEWKCFENAESDIAHLENTIFHFVGMHLVPRSRFDMKKYHCVCSIAVWSSSYGVLVRTSYKQSLLLVHTLSTNGRIPIIWNQHDKTGSPYGLTQVCLRSYVRIAICWTWIILSVRDTVNYSFTSWHSSDVAVCDSSHILCVFCVQAPRSHCVILLGAHNAVPVCT